MAETTGHGQEEARPRERFHAPAGVAAVVAGALASVAVFRFDDLEVLSGRLFGEGAMSFLGIILLFLLAWLLIGLVVLAPLARWPAREGLWAGGLVTLSMLWFLLGDDPPDEEIPVRLFIWVPFAALAVGCGAVAGLLAQRVRGASPAGGRLAAFVAIGAMVPILVVAVWFLGRPTGPFPVVIGLIVFVVAGGALAWLATTRDRRGPA